MVVTGTMAETGNHQILQVVTIEVAIAPEELRPPPTPAVRFRAAGGAESNGAAECAISISQEHRNLSIGFWLPRDIL